MESSSVILELQSFFAEDAWARVIPVLRQNALIWQALQNQEFRVAAKKRLGPAPEGWSPANLALISLKCNLYAEDLRQTPRHLPEEIAARSDEVYQDYLNNNALPNTLPQAGLLALALIKHPADWSTLPQTPNLDAALACLVGLLPTPAEFLARVPAEQVVQSLLANPLEHEKHIEMIAKRLTIAPPDERLSVLNMLRAQRPHFAAQLARQITTASSPSTEKGSPSTRPTPGPRKGVTATLQSPIASLQELLQQADYQDLSDHPESAQAALQSAQKAAQEIHAAIALEMACAEIRAGRPEQALALWEEHNHTPLPDDNATLALVLIEQGFFDQAKSLFVSAAEHTPTAKTLVAEARIAIHEGRLAQAQALGMQALQTAPTFDDSAPAKLLLELELTEEAIELAARDAEDQPNNPQAIQRLAEAYLQACAPEDALPWLQLGTALSPDDKEIRRKLAQTFMLLQRWPQAIQTYEHLIPQGPSGSSDDRRALAEARVHNDDLGGAQQILAALIEADPQDGLALACLGEALERAGAHSEAWLHFEKAIRTSPHDEQPWLAFAAAQQRANNSKGALQTLQTAARALPDSAAIQLALGKQQHRANAPTQALQALRRAAELGQSKTIAAMLRAEIDLTFAQALRRLGHHDEAHEKLAAAHRRSPAHAGITRMYAVALREAGTPERALPVIITALHRHPEDIDLQFEHARVLLASGAPGPQVETVLQYILELNKNHHPAIALLAEVYESDGKTQAALEAYRLALGGPLGEGAHWQCRLSLGLSRTAFKLGQNEIALAALEPIWENNPEDAGISRLLSDIYIANQLATKALQAAQAALQTDLSNPDTVLWFAEQALRLDAPKQALHALEKALRQDAQQPRYHLRYGQILLESGDLTAAQSAFEQLIGIETARPTELIQAADGLLATDDPARAAVCLERAAALAKSSTLEDAADSQAQALHLSILTRLIDTHEKLGAHSVALEIIEEALGLQSDHILLKVKKADLHLKMDALAEAARWVSQCLEKTPEDPHLNLQAAIIAREQGNIATALTCAKLAVKHFNPRAYLQHYIEAVMVTAQLEMSFLQKEKAFEILTEAQGQALNLTAIETIRASTYFCLQGELALAADEEIAAAEALTAAVQLTPEHPRTLALQARLRLRQGNGQFAAQTLEEALIQFGSQGDAPVDMCISIAEAAIECMAWGPATYLLQQAAKSAPQEALPQAELARALVLRAEYQHLCRTVNIQWHALGDSAISASAFENFEQAILRATRNLENYKEQNSPIQPQAFLSLWLARGQAIFQPSREHAQALLDLPPRAENQSACLAALRHSGETKLAARHALKLAAQKNISQNPLLWAQIALALTREDPVAALAAAQRALDTSIRQNIGSNPVFHALRATVAHRVEDHPAHLQAVQALLAVWDNEPYWHTIAADLLLEQQEQIGPTAIQEAVAYLERVIFMEPLKSQHHKKLSQALLAANETQGAVAALRKAVRLEPNEHLTWLQLAQVHRLTGENDQAVECAKQAGRLMPASAEPFVVLAEAALENGEPETASQYTAKALSNNSGHPRALLLHADALTALEKPTEALIALEAAAARILPSTPLLLKMIELRRQLHGPKAAAEALDQLRTQYPEDVQIQIALAHALAENHQSERAIQTAQKVLSRADEDLSADNRARLLFLLGLLLRRSGQLDQAVQHLSEAVDHTPEWVEPYIELGRTYYERRQYDLALQTCQQAIAIAPGDPRPYHWAGTALKDIKDFRNAEIMLRTAAGLAPDDISIHRKLGAIVALNLVHNPRKNVDVQTNL